MGACCSDVNTAKHAVGTSPVMASDSAGREAQDAAGLLSGAANYSSWVEVRLSCKGLKKKDITSKSDPMAILYAASPGGERELGRTEVVSANHNPTFTVAFKVLYNFEKLQPLRLLVVDIDDDKTAASINPAKCDFLGEHTFTLSELVTSKNRTMTCKLHTRSAHVSMATLSVEELSSAREVITCQLAATGLKNIEIMSKSDPYLEISKKQQGDGTGSWQPLFKTEVKNNNLNPIWAPFSIRTTQLNNGDPYRPLLLKVLDYEAMGKPRVMGQVEASAHKLEESFKSQAPLALTAPDKPASGLGSLMVRSWEVVSQPTFLDYISAGTEISFLVALDFTASNQPPSDPASLHYARPGAFTRYEEALCGVGRVLEYYDSDRMFPAWGFGGVRGKGPVSHCFPLNDRPDALCGGIQGIMEAYRQALSNWRLSGPTLFAPIINAACAIAAQPTAHLRYNVLLILTDGEIMDMNETVEAIITASNLPLSILIVGIGNADFVNMVQLDGDGHKLARDGRIAERDIVQFVEFNKFANNGEALAAELLAELPGQFLAYTRARKIPLPAEPTPTAPPP